MVSNERERQFMEKLRATFRDEACEHVAELDARYADLTADDNDTRAAAVESAFREAHTLKAAARAVGQREIERLCQSMESAFALQKRSRSVPVAELMQALRDAIDTVRGRVATLDTAPSQGELERASDLIRTLDNALDGANAGQDGAASPETVAAKTGPAGAPKEPQEGRRPSPPATTASGTVRLPVIRLESLMRQSEEMIAVKLVARTQVLRVTEALDTQHEWERRWQRARIALQALNARRARVLTSASAVEADADTAALECLLQFLEWNETHARARAASLSVIGRAAQNHARDLSSKVDRILEHVKDTLVLQCATLLEALPHMVRDLARDQGKDADLVLEGAELEMDRRVLDALREPLLHLVRNCVDHGIERPEQRIAAGKPRRATLRIAVRQKDGDKAEITVEDDGAGISSTRVAAAAVHLGLVPAERETALRECEAASLIFESGLSTSAIVSEVSGRGLGLAIVREKVENLGGTIDVESRSGAGTCFRLLVPLTLATFRGVCVEAEQRLFVLPTLGLDRVTGFNPDALGSVENRPVLWIERTPVPLVRLAQVLELPHACPREPGRKRYAAVLGAAGRRIAFEVDAVLGDEEILVKPLGRYLLRVRNVLGATVLGSGRIAPILNVHDLLKSATRVAAGRTPDAPPAGAVSARRIRILVVEDSITARGLLKNILEASGHAVKTAVDGRDAWATLNLEPFDVVVSDVEMPRMNGFDLTARIRADARLAELPVVLLTALESREDRERGVDVGANAYIVKSDFNQQRLLELVRRLT